MINEYGVGADADEKPVLRQIAAALGQAGEDAELRVGDEVIPLPESAREALARVASFLTTADFVSIESVDSQLTTQEAADMLGVSRPYLIERILGTGPGQIPYTTRTSNSTHRRVKLSDVLLFRSHRAREMAEQGRPLLDAARKAYLERPASERPTVAANRPELERSL
jgi:hypothetical protein